MPRRIDNYYFVRDRSDREDISWVRAEQIKQGQFTGPVVLINGAFDLLHTSHMRLIFEARGKANPLGTVICALDSDRKIRESKGPGRPVMSWPERYAALQYMPIDVIIEVDSDLEMRDLIRRVKPDLRVQGVEYRGQSSRYPWLRKAYIRDGGTHCSDIIKRCYDSYMKGLEENTKQ